MKQCAVIASHAINNYRKELVQSHVDFFKSKNIDVILIAAEHIAEYKGANNYVTINSECDRVFSTILPELHSIFCTEYKGFHSYGFYSGRGINPANYFVTMYKTAFSYCDNLGYEFAYFLNYDSILNKKYISSLIDNPKDFSKIYLHCFPWYPTFINVDFFFGNVQQFLAGLSPERLDYLEQSAKTKQVLGPEGSMFELFSSNENVVFLDVSMDDFFDKWNLITKRNYANILYDRDDKKYIFLFAKGDKCESPFSCELLLDGNIIFSNTTSTYGAWNMMHLDFNKNYTIKYYDDCIGADTLSEIKTVHTDSEQIVVRDWSENIKK